MKKIMFASLMALILMSCSSQDSKPLRIMHWGGTQEMQAIDSIIADLKEQKGIIATQDRAPSGNPYMEKVVTQMAAGMPPDVMLVEVNNFKEFALRNALEDLTPYINADNSINIKDYYPEIIDRFTIDGKLYVLPRDIAPMCVIYYNKKAFDEAGLAYPKDNWTVNEFLETAKKLVKKDAKGNITRFGFLDEWPIWEAWAYTFGGRLVDDVKHPKKCVMDSAATVNGIQFRADMIHKFNVMPRPAQVVYSGSYDASGLFISGKTAMFYSGIWKTPFFREIKGFEWDVVMFPASSDGSHAYPTGGSGYAIAKGSRKKQQAWETVKRLSGEKGQSDLAAIGLLQPAIMRLAASPVFLDGKDPKNKKIVLEGVKNVVFYPLHERWEEINISYTAPALDRVWNGSKSARQAMDEVVPEINRIYFGNDK
ncbi:MAG TPA: ABC transporter substrate-binding protein [Candidatus Goldiibacteriota bacterium]|nr:ABC transporter substrate-binding protein [Candidatus Goldiibacteriota bacterium]